MELTTNGTTLRLIDRRQPAEIKGLGVKQIEWLERRFPGISRNRVTRLRAAEAYRLPELVEARATVSEVV